MDKSPFGRLPAEIRNAIYTLVLVTQNSDNTSNTYFNPRMLGTCRKIHDEAKIILYQENTVVVDIHPFGGYAHIGRFGESVREPQQDVEGPLISLDFARQSWSIRYAYPDVVRRFQKFRVHICDDEFQYTQLTAERIDKIVDQTRLGNPVHLDSTKDRLDTLCRFLALQPVIRKLEICYPLAARPTIGHLPQTRRVLDPLRRLFGIQTVTFRKTGFCTGIPADLERVYKTNMQRFLPPLNSPIRVEWFEGCAYRLLNEDEFTNRIRSKGPEDRRTWRSNCLEILTNGEEARNSGDMQGFERYRLLFIDAVSTRCFELMQEAKKLDRFCAKALLV
ncbi:hypothetical protein MMC24_006992 [Lignoscripta atroalba]|nr:hypothetical protein [Lignoscripta atroalba]